MTQHSRSNGSTVHRTVGRQKRRPWLEDRLPDRPGVSSLTWSFPGTPADVSCSRRWLAVAATEVWGESEDTDRLVLAYSEIATNAVVHSTGPVSVTARISPSSARCEVADRSPQLPRARRADSTDTGGRGLEMVQLTVDRLLVTADDIGKTVSFEVGRRHEDRQRPGAEPA